MLLAETYWNLMHDPAHWGFELTLELLTGVVGFLVGRVMLRRHDARHHMSDNRSETGPNTGHPNPLNHYGFKPVKKDEQRWYCGIGDCMKSYTSENMRNAHRQFVHSHG